MKEDLLRHVDRIWVKGEKDAFPLEKEVILFLFRIWVLWPEFGPRRAITAKLVAGIITLQRYDAKLRPKLGKIKSLTELRQRVTEPWYEQFYKQFFSQEWIGGIGSLIDVTRTSRQQDSLIARSKRSRAISIDIMDFLLRATRQAPDLAQVNIAAWFISMNGFERPHRYDLRRGERKKASGIGYDKVYISWKNSKPTLGIDFVITKHFKELNSLRISDPNFLLTLSRLANDDQKIRTILAQYHWLLDFFRKENPAITKVRHWPFLPDFKDRQPLDIQPLTDRQLQTAQKAQAEQKKLSQKRADRQAPQDSAKGTGSGSQIAYETRG
jgi:hypothetical protein